MLTNRSILTFSKFLLMTFVSFFILIFLTFYGILFYSSFKDINIVSQSTINCIKKIINRNNNIVIDISSISVYGKNFLDKKSINVKLRDVSIKHKKISLSVIKLGDIDMIINPAKVFLKGLKANVNIIQDKTINIPLNVKVIDGDLKEDNLNIEENIENIVKKALLFFNNYQSIIENGIDIKNIDINLLDISKNSKINSFKIVDSSTEFVNVDNLSKDKKQSINKLIFKLENGYKNRNDKSNDELNVLKQIKNYVNNYQNNRFGNILLNKTLLNYNNKNIELNNICLYNKYNKISNCLFSVDKLNISFNEEHKIFNYSLQSELLSNFKLFIKFADNSVKDAILDGEIKINSKNNGQKQKKQYDINTISFNFDVKNNFKTIEKSSILLKGLNKVYMSISSNKTISFKKNIFVGGEIQVNIKDIILSNFYKILNDKINISKSISNFDGVVDGALYFTFNNKGKLVPIEKNNSKIKIKKLIINSNTFDYDLSSIVFSLEVFQNEIVLKSYSNNDRNKYISVHCRDGYFFIKMKDFIVDKTHFAKIKQLFLDRTQFNILKNIELSWIANGDIEIPFDISSFARNSMFNFKFDILSADNDKKGDDEIFFKVYKKKGNNTGKAVIDFGKSDMYSNIFDFKKNKDDKSIINSKIVFNSGQNISFKVDSVWKLNNELKSTSHIYVDEKKNIDVALNSKQAGNIEIKQKDIDYVVSVYGNLVNIDYELWHLILAGIVMLDTPGVLTIKINVPKGSIQDIKFNNFYSFLNLQKPYFWGKFYWTQEYNGQSKKMYFNNLDDNKYELLAEDIVPLFTLYDIDINNLQLKTILLGGNGKNNIKNREIEGNLKIDIGNKNDSVFNYTQVNSVDIEKIKLGMKEFGITNAKIDGRWFIGLFNFISKTDKVKLDGKVRILTPIKSWFNKNKKLSNDDNIILKEGKTFKEFVNNMTINDKDFSNDKDGNLTFTKNDIIKVIKL